MTLNILIAFTCAAGVILLLWLLRGVMLTPIDAGKNTRCTVTLTVSGSEPRLEGTIEGLIWLRCNGTLRADIVIEDAGMDAETREVAILAARHRSFITIISNGDAEI